MGELSDQENERLGIDRASQDAFALDPSPAAAATESGRLAEEIAPVKAAGGELDRDEGIRPDTTPSGSPRCRPRSRPTGTITAGNASQLSDAAAAGLVTSLHAAREAGLDRWPRWSGAPWSRARTRRFTCAPRKRREAARKARAHRCRHRPLGDQRGLRRRRPRCHRTPSTSTPSGSTSTAARSPSATARRVRLPARAHPRDRAPAPRRHVRHRDLCGGGGQGEAVLLRRL
jgi:hypothetical protein